MTKLCEYIGGNAYPGRGVLAGQTADGRAVIAYFIMGRSANSRNRVFAREGDDITIYPYDETKVEDPSLIIYHPVRTLENSVVFTNGDQTDTVHDALISGGSFEGALATRTFEPDSPNYTPRVSGLLSFDKGGFSYTLSILKRQSSGGCARQFFNYAPAPGVAHLIHTYMGDGAPLPCFRGEPAELTLDATDARAIADAIWASLDKQNRVALYVRVMNSARDYTDALINRFTPEDAK